MHHGDAIGDGERLFLIVGHIDGGKPELLAHAPDLLAHGVPQAGVQVGKRLVEQQALGPDHQRPRERHPLLLAARELIDAPLQMRLHAHRLERVPHALSGLALRDTALLEAKGDVFRNGEMRPQGEALEHHPRIAQRGGPG